MIFLANSYINVMVVLDSGIGHLPTHRDPSTAIVLFKGSLVICQIMREAMGDAR